MVDYKIIQIALSKPHKRYKVMMEKVREIAHDYELITEWVPRHKKFYDSIPPESHYHWLRSDVIRFEYLSEHENVLYLDWDVNIKYLPNVNSLTWTMHYDYWAIFNGYETSVFDSILEKGVEINRKVQAKSIGRNWLMDEIKNVGGGVFDKECMCHG